jgi:hypothetical protein
MELKFEVNGQTIARIDKNFIVKGKESGIIARFSFVNLEGISESKAVFYQKGIRHLVNISEGACKVPIDIIDVPSFKLAVLLDSGEETESASVLVSKTDNIAEMSASEVSQFIFAELARSSNETTKLQDAVIGLETAVAKLINNFDEIDNKVNSLQSQISTISETLVVEDNTVKFDKPVEVAGTVTATMFNIGE